MQFFVCAQLDALNITDKYEMIVTVLLLERLWGVTLNLIKDEDLERQVKEEFNAIAAKETGLNKLEEKKKQATREQRMELVQAPTPADIKNKAMAKWMHKVSHRVDTINSFQELIRWWYGVGQSKMANEVLDQWVLKNTSIMFQLDVLIYHFIKGEVQTPDILDQITWFSVQVKQLLAKSKE